MSNFGYRNLVDQPCNLDIIDFASPPHQLWRYKSPATTNHGVTALQWLTITAPPAGCRRANSSKPVDCINAALGANHQVRCKRYIYFAPQSVIFDKFSGKNDVA